jgi:HAD superfamily hydrolase (TIGR01450 family)
MAPAGDLVLSHYSAFLVDVDGVLTCGRAALPGAAAALAALRSFGRPLVFTNNSTRSRDELAEHLMSLGFDVGAEDVIGSAFLAARYLSLHFGPSAVWILGEDGVRWEMAAAGHRVVENPTEASWVVVGMDRRATYEKLALALRAALNGARVLATNEDATFPTASGLVPGAGALVGALRGMGFPPEVVVGKPSPAAFEVALDVLGVGPDRILVIGDRLETDIAGARAAGLDSVLVLTGVSSADEARRSAVPPAWIAESLSELCAGRATPLAGEGSGKAG